MLIHRGVTLTAWLFLALFLGWSPVLAAGINIFAWLENDHILVQCEVSRGQPAIGAAVTVYDSTNRRELATGKTNKDGRFSFTVPEVVRQGHGLLLAADAGQGHQGEWTMSAAEIYSAASLEAGFDEAAIQAKKNSQAHIPVKPSTSESHLSQPGQNGSQTDESEQKPAAPAKPALEREPKSPQSPTVNQADPRDANPPLTPPASEKTQDGQTHSGAPAAPLLPVTLAPVNQTALTQADIRKIIQEELRHGLTPIQHAIAARHSNIPTVIEIVGGIGWIAGLVGGGLYLKSRKR